MPRAKKASENEAESKPVRRTRQTSVVTDSPVRRSTRNKRPVDSSPESIIESTSVPKRSARKRTPTPDLESSQTTKNLRKRNVKSESEAPATQPVNRVTRRTRASSVAAETSKLNSKKSAGTPVKGRGRLVSLPTEPSLLEEEKDDFETSEKSVDKQNFSSESFEKTDDDQPQETSSREEEIEESRAGPAEDSITIIDEITSIKSVIKKKEQYTDIEKRVMSRMLSSKLNFSENESLNGSKIDEISELEIKKELRSSKQEFQISSLENNEVAGEKSSDEKIEFEEEVFKEKTPRKKSGLGRKSFGEDNNSEFDEEKSPRRSSWKKSSLGKKTFGEEDESLEEGKNKEFLKEKTLRKSGGRKSLKKKSFGEETESNGLNNEKSPEEVSYDTESPNKKEKTPHKEKTPLKEKTPYKENTPLKEKTPGKEKTPVKEKTPHKEKNLLKEKTPKKDPTPSRLSNEFPVDEGVDLIDETKDENFFPEPMEVDISDPKVDDSNNENDIETIDVPEKMSRHFKPRKSMIDNGSDKLSVSKDRVSLGNKKLDFFDFSIQKGEKSRQPKGIDSESNNYESKSLVDDRPSGNIPRNRKSLTSVDRKSLSSEKRKLCSSEKRDSYSLSDGPTSFQLLVTPDRDELSKSKEKTPTLNLNKSSEKKSRKRKRDSSEWDESYELSVLDNKEEFFTEKDVNKDTTLTEENTENGEGRQRNRRSLSRKRSKSIEFAKETEEEAAGEKKIPKKDESLLSKSLEEGKISNSEEEFIYSGDEDELLKSYEECLDKNQKRRSKSKSFGWESKMEEKGISNRKSFNDNRSMSSSLEYGNEFGEKEKSSLKKSSGKEENERESESEYNKSNKPVVRNIEILKDNDSNSLVQRLKVNSEERQVSEKTPKKLNKPQTEKKLEEGEENGEGESSAEELTDEESLSTVKRVRKSKSIGTTPSLSSMKSKCNKLKDLEGSEKRRIGKQNAKESFLDVSSKIPAFMFSQTSSDSEDDEEGSGEEGSKSIDSDIAKEYNLDGETISHYSDDDVLADDCRDSESEHSDSEDEGSDLADFVTDGSEEEDEESEEVEQDVEGSDDSVFDHSSGKSLKVAKPEIDTKNLVPDTDEEKNNEENEPEETEKESSPVKVKETRKSLKISTKDQNLDREIKIQDMETDIQKRNLQIEANKKSPEHERKLRVNLCSESESENSTDTILNNFKTKASKSLMAIESVVEENKENTKISKKLKKKKEKEESKAEAAEVSSSEKQEKKNLEVKGQIIKKRKPVEKFSDLEESFPLKETKKKKKKSKRKLKATGSKFPVACSTLYEATSDSEEESETLSFADARNEALEASKKKSERIKAGKELKKNKKKGGHVDESKVGISSSNTKRLPDELIEELEDVPRPKKRQKVSKKSDFETPSLGMHDRRYSLASKSKSLISASDYGSTTDFEVVSFQQKEKKQKAQSSLALKWFKQRMAARNIRQPISVYLSQQQKRRAAGKDLF